MFAAFRYFIDYVREDGALILIQELCVDSTDEGLKCLYDEWLQVNNTYAAGLAEVISSYTTLENGEVVLYNEPNFSGTQNLEEVAGDYFVAGDYYIYGDTPAEKSKGLVVCEFTVCNTLGSEENKAEAFKHFNERVLKGINKGDVVFIGRLIEDSWVFKN